MILISYIKCLYKGLLQNNSYLPYLKPLKVGLTMVFLKHQAHGYITNQSQICAPLDFFETKPKIGDS